ncbi:MAG: DUF4097 family beta strand repeat-containing protein [Parashewanella sp.]
MKTGITSIVTSMMISMPFMTLAAEKVDKTLAVTASPSINIEVKRGDVSIKSWDKNQVQVIGTLDDYSEGLIFKKRGNSITIEDKVEQRIDLSGKAGSKLKIMVPKKLRLDAEGVSTDFDVSKLSGDIRVSSVSGDIDAKSLQGSPELKSISGEINANDLSGEIQLSSVSGQLNDKNSKGSIRYNAVSGDLNAHTQASHIEIQQVSGQLNGDFSMAKSLQIKLVSGDAKFSVNGDINSLKAQSVSGDVMVKFSKLPDANVEIDGGPGGDIQNKLTQDKPKKARYTGAESLDITIGKGTANIRMDTISGDLILMVK